MAEFYTLSDGSVTADRGMVDDRSVTQALQPMLLSLLIRQCPRRCVHLVAYIQGQCESVMCEPNAPVCEQENYTLALQMVVTRPTATRCVLWSNVY